MGKILIIVSLRFERVCDKTQVQTDCQPRQDELALFRLTRDRIMIRIAVRDDAAVLVMSQVTGAKLKKVSQGLNGGSNHPSEDQVFKHIDSITKTRRHQRLSL